LKIVTDHITGFLRPKSFPVRGYFENLEPKKAYEISLVYNVQKFMRKQSM
jgi:hypothetical protein